jgi:hypothetical protein
VEHLLAHSTCQDIHHSHQLRKAQFDNQNCRCLGESHHSRRGWLCFERIPFDRIARQRLQWSRKALAELRPTVSSAH